jgi:hypothetical protein
MRMRMSKNLRWLVLCSLGCLLIGSIGAGVAIATDLPARFGGLLHGTNVPQDFVLLSGTALSPPLVLLVAQLACIVCAFRPGRLGTIGVAGLVLLGACYVAGQIGEPITARALTPATFNALHASIALAIIVLSALMCVFGVREWRARRQASQRADVQPDVPAGRRPTGERGKA